MVMIRYGKVVDSLLVFPLQNFSLLNLYKENPLTFNQTKRGAMEKEEEGAVATSPLITVNVKFSSRTIPLSVSPDSTIKDLKSLLQPLTNVLVRGQKLIFKGKVLTDTMNLTSSKVLDGSKIMLMASQGLHQGDGPITKDGPTSPNLRWTGNGNKAGQNMIVAPIGKSRVERWKLIGVVALSESCLKVVPEEVWDCGPSVRVLDISNNSIQEVPAKISSLSSIQKLLANANDISDNGICWEVLRSFKSLRVLSLNQNHLSTLPASLGALTSLQELHVGNNKLTGLPDEIGLLRELRVLKANNNRIRSIPSSIGNCSSLMEVDFSSNLLVELPEMFGNLQSLKALYLSKNGLKSLPTTLFKMCSQLSTLDLHGTELTMDLLRQLEGWKDFDERRRSKHQKQLDFRAGSSGVFDEGADENVGP